MNLKTHISLSIACFFWALSFIATKVALTSMGVMTLAGVRHVSACLCFAGWIAHSLKTKTAWPKFSWKVLFNLFVLSLLAVSMHHISQITGLKYTTAANASIYVSTGPIMIFLISAVFLKEKLSGRKILGVLFALTGVLLVTGIDTLLAFDFSGRLYGDFFVAFSVFTWACFTVFSKKTVTNFSPMQLTASIVFLGTLTLLPFTYYELQISTYSLAKITLEAWMAAFFLGVTSSFIAILLYLQALKKTETQKVALYLYTIPPMTAFMAVYFLDEAITPSLVVGTILIFFGLFIAQRKVGRVQLPCDSPL